MNPMAAFFFGGAVGGAAVALVFGCVAASVKTVIRLSSRRPADPAYTYFVSEVERLEHDLAEDDDWLDAVIRYRELKKMHSR